MKATILFLSIITLVLVACKKDAPDPQMKGDIQTNSASDSAKGIDKSRLMWWNVREYGDFKTLYDYYRPNGGC